MWWIGWMWMMFAVIYSMPAFLFVAMAFFIISMYEN